MKARTALVILVALSLEAAATPAQAAFHLTKVTEVFGGQLLQPNADFVELQMYQSGQALLAGHKLTFYAADGTATECTIPQNISNGANQAHILFATAEAQAAFGTADFTIPSPLVSPGGGAVCFGLGVDCVTWGSFSGSVTDDKGAVTNPEAAIPADQSIHRSLGADATLQATDDTNNSANDFSPAAESATSNGPLNLGALSCIGGGGNTDTEAPSSEITAPAHKTAITVQDSRNFQGKAKDQGGSKIAKVELAMRQKRKEGCRWWTGSSFVAGACGEKTFFEVPDADNNWSYTLSKNLKPSGRRIKNYTLYSRATDGAGNVEPGFTPGENQVRFEVYKPPIVCGQPPC